MGGTIPMAIDRRIEEPCQSENAGAPKKQKKNLPYESHGSCITTVLENKLAEANSILA